MRSLYFISSIIPYRNSSAAYAIDFVIRKCHAKTLIE